MFVAFSKSQPAVEAVWNAAALRFEVDAATAPTRLVAADRFMVLDHTVAETPDDATLVVGVGEKLKPPTSATTVAPGGSGTLLHSLRRALHRGRSDGCKVIVERRSGVAVAVAEPMGLPALYLTSVRDDTVIAATDLAALLAGRRALCPPPVVDPKYFAYFLTGLPENELVPRLWRTAYQGVYILPPGHLIELGHARAKPERYWRYWADSPLRGSQCLEAVEDAFRQAVTRTCSPRFTGVALSGGTDSACVAAAARAVVRSQMACYINYSPASIVADERCEARSVTDAIGVPLRTIESSDAWATCQSPASATQVEPHQGWFHAQDRALAGWAMQDGADVVLDGIGGDELFGIPLHNPYVSENDVGLPPISELDVVRMLRRRRRSSWHPIIGVGDLTPRFMSPHFASSTDLAARMREIGSAVGELGMDPVSTHRLFSFAFTGTPLSECTWLSREVFGPAGIERRHPYRDPGLVETVFRVPVRLMASPVVWKPLLHRLHARLLPTVRPRRLKGDYSELFFRGFLRKRIDLVREVHHDSVAAQLSWVDQAEVRGCLDEYLRKPTFRSVESERLHLQLWQLLVTEQWLRSATTSGLVRA